MSGTDRQPEPFAEGLVTGRCYAYLDLRDPADQQQEARMKPTIKIDCAGLAAAVVSRALRDAAAALESGDVLIGQDFGVTPASVAKVETDSATMTLDDIAPDAGEQE